MVKSLFKLLAFYVLVFGIVGVLIELNASLSSTQIDQNLFVRGAPLDFVAAFLVTPIFALMSLFFSIVRMSTFNPDVIELHLMIVLFFGFATFGLLKDRWFILVIAALVPISWTIIDLDLIRFI
jgi:hypothetical protein